MYIVENSQRQRTTAAWQKVLSFLIRCAVRIFAVTTRGGKEVAGGLGELKSQWCVYLCLPGVFSFSLAKLICWLPATCSNACRQTSPAHRHPRRTSSEAPRYPRFRGSEVQIPSSWDNDTICWQIVLALISQRNNNSSSISAASAQQLLQWHKSEFWELAKWHKGWRAKSRQGRCWKYAVPVVSAFLWGCMQQH